VLGFVINFTAMGRVPETSTQFENGSVLADFQVKDVK
jgi:hypothetical protein